VAAARVTARRNPFSGSVLTAEVVPVSPPADPEAFKSALLRHCRERLPKEAVPALVKLLDQLEVNAAGKLRRN
jgi:acyl-CoA synthetase (AMP-forming)/AMP-acid ligase II